MDNPFNKQKVSLDIKKKVNKKGQFATDMWDGMLILIFSVVFFVIVGLSLAWNNEVSNKQPIKNIEQFHLKDSALNNLFVESQENNLEGKDIDVLVKSSKILGGKVISSCGDYSFQEDCKGDAVNLYPAQGDCCQWGDDNRCRIGPRSYCREIEAEKKE